MKDSISPNCAQRALPQSNGNGHVDEPDGNGQQLLLWFVYHAEELEPLRAGGLDVTDRENLHVSGRHVAVLHGAGDQYALKKAPLDVQLMYRTGALTVRVVVHHAARGKMVGDIFASGAATISELEQWAEDARIEPRQEQKRSRANKIIRGKNRTWAPCLHNSKLWLAKHKLDVKIRYDRFRQSIYLDEEAISDELVIALTAEIEATLSVPWRQEHVRSALIYIGHKNQYSSLTNWLDSLAWDGTPRINTFFVDAFGCVPDAYSAECGKVLFISAVARAYVPGCQADVMPVLIGAQGLGKSMGLACLCPNPDWFTDDIGDLADKRSSEGLRGKWLVEFSEFSRINRATVETAKGFLTRRSDWYRPAYGRTNKDFPRTCVFIGTTNNAQPLQDQENRRYMPITCTKGDLDWIAANRDQLSAEAVHRYQAGDKWWVTDPKLLEECREKQEAARFSDAWESILAEALIADSQVTLEEVCKILHLGIDKLDKAAQTRIGISLKNAGFTRKRKRVLGALIYVWER